MASPIECGLYLADSTLPNAGFGVFMGNTPFQAHEEIPLKSLAIMMEATDALLDDFLWDTTAMGGARDASRSLWMGPIGSMANRFVRPNVHEHGLKQTLQEDDGSSTTYHSMTFQTSQYVGVGQELLMPTDDEWMQWAEQPVFKDYQILENHLKSLKQLHEKHPEVTEAQWIELLHKFKTDFQPSPMIVDNYPSTKDELVSMLKDGPYPNTQRSLEWLQEHGMCLDHINEGTSSRGGKGAFAQRSLAKGTTVVPMPLVQVMNKEKIQNQLLLNYCFAHSHSDILFCPTTNAGLINHSSEEANVRLKWSDTSKNRLDQELKYFTKDLDELKIPVPRNHVSDRSTKLLMEVVALRDIEEGEEILLDYGIEWEQAFQEHRRTKDTLLKLPDPNNIEVEQIDSLPTNYECRIFPFAREQFSGDAMLEDYQQSAQTRIDQWDEATRGLHQRNDFISWYPCRVLEEEGPKVFQVDVFGKSIDEVIYRYKNMPISSIRHATRSAQHHPDAFRHPIMMSDDVFPLHWRDDYMSTSEINLGNGSDDDPYATQAQLDEYEASIRKVKCGRYFAPSNIPNAGFGTYTNVDMPTKGIVMGSDMPIVAFPRKFSEGWAMNDYVWHGKTFQTEFDSLPPLPITISAGNEGSLANFHAGLVNVNTKEARFHPLLDRCKDPGAGASSEYLGASFVSGRAIQAGDETFVSYGETWITARAYFEDIPVSANFNEANRMISSAMALVHTGAGWSKEAALSMLHGMAEFSVEHRTTQVFNNIKTVEQLERVLASNGTAEATVEKRTPEWLEEKGHCIDHIYLGRSTIKQAGMGGFTRRSLKKGETVISSPLIATYGNKEFNLTSPTYRKNLRGSHCSARNLKPVGVTKLEDIVPHYNLT